VVGDLALMLSQDEQLLRLIDSRIEAGRARTEAFGTCVSRNGSGSVGYVIFDGSQTPVPVKVAGYVVLRPAMRCMLAKFGTVWVVVGTFAAPALGRASLFAFCSGAQTTVLGSFADHPGLSAFTFTKYHDNTIIDTTIAVSGFSTAVSTACRWALRFTQTSGDIAYTPADLGANQIYWSTANVRQYATVSYDNTAAIPAGVYSVRLRWRRDTGSGTVTNSSDDLYSVRMREFFSDASPNP
jgi:hypothetical protein